MTLTLTDENAIVSERAAARAREAAIPARHDIPRLCVRRSARLSYEAVALGRVVHVVAALVLLGSICGDIVSSRCDLPAAGGRSQAGVSVATGDTAREGDRCASGCMPDCYGCSRIEVAAAVQVESQPQIAVAAVPPPLARVSDGVIALPYHPPLPLF